MRIVKMLGLVSVLVAFGIIACELPLGGGEEGCNDCEPLVIDLIAGQHMVVGTVTVKNDPEKVCVTYALDEDALEEGWLLYETHLYMGATDAFPLTRHNNRLGEPYYANPVPGKFPYGDDELEGVSEYTECVSFDDLGVEFDDFNADDEIYLAAHAVIERFEDTATSAVLYGNIGGYAPDKEGQGDIWEIDPITKTETLIFKSQDIHFEANWYPNALAYDEENHRLYFTTTRNTLKFYDLSSKELKNADPGGKIFKNNNNVLGATFGDGSFWYILNQSGMLYQVDFDEDGLVTEIEGHEMTEMSLTQGDIVYKDGVIIGSSGTGAGGLKGFFSYDIESGAFDVLHKGGPDFAAPQLAWGLDADGEIVLYATLGGDQQNLLTVDKIEDGKMTEIFITDNRYQDLASKFIYEEIWEDETAWGEGKRFNERGNWGMWFTYKICGPVLLEVLKVSAEEETAVDSIELDEGTDYLIEASGTYKFVDWATPEDPDLGYADAKYSHRKPNTYADNTENEWVSGDDLDEPYTNYLELLIDDESQAWGVFNPEHIYQIVRPGAGESLSFSILDNNYADNEGFLTVKIYKLY